MRHFESLRIKSPYKYKFLSSRTSFMELLVDLKLSEK